MAALNADARVMEYFPAALSREESDTLASRIEAHFEQHSFGLWAVEIPNVTSFAGFIGLSVPPFEAHFTPCVEIGWRLAAEYWGLGYATEGARAVLAFGFEALGLDEVVSFTAPGNLRSRRVMEKIGMVHNPADDFDHPALPEGHRLRRHVLYRMARLSLTPTVGRPRTDSSERREHLMQPSLSPRLTPQIVVDQPVVLYDAPLSIALEGFAPRARVTVTATFQVAEALPWRSWATFITDDGGRVDVTRQAPIAGTYEGVSPMGLFWSATPVPGKSRPAPSDWVMWPSVARLHAEAPSGASAELTVERRLAGGGVSRRPVREAGVVGTLFLPPGEGPHPAVIVLGGSDGGISEHRAALVASHDYAALALAYFGATDLPAELVNVPVEYFEHAIGWMRGQPWLRDSFLAVWGASRGGELALLLGATIPAINAVIAYVASGVLHGPFEPHDPPDTPACWTSGGEPLPYLQEHNATDDPTSVDYTRSPVAESPRYLSQLRDVNAVERATIPVERTQGPILLVSGQDDQIWPSSILTEIAIRRLQQHGHPHPFRHLSYEGAGHAIYIPYAPTTQIEYTHPNGVHYTGGGAPRANSEAGADAWRHVLAFLEESARSRG